MMGIQAWSKSRAELAEISWFCIRNETIVTITTITVRHEDHPASPTDALHLKLKRAKMIDASPDNLVRTFLSSLGRVP